LADKDARNNADRASGTAAIVAVQIADFQPAGIVLDNARFELEGRNFGGSVGTGHIPQRGIIVTLRCFSGGGKLLLAESYSVFIIYIR
jgi:hypothetical protein